jgi:hypothetical protein
MRHNQVGKNGEKVIMGGTYVSSLEERFHVQYEIASSGCWVWVGATNSLGTPAIKNNYKTLTASRVGWELENGEIPVGMDVIKRCSVKKCVNPAHMFLGTHQDAMDHKVKQGRQARGDTIGEPLRKRFLDKNEVLAIYGDNGVSARVIGEKYGISRHSVSNIKTGRTWSHITGHKDTKKKTTMGEARKTAGNIIARRLMDGLDLRKKYGLMAEEIEANIKYIAERLKSKMQV